MTGPDHTRDDAHLGAFFEAARAERPGIGDDLMARVMADAAAETGRQAYLAAARAPRRPGVWALMLATLGGQGAVAGLAAAAVTGLWVGLAPPATLQVLAPGLFGTAEAADLIPDIDSLLAFAAEG